MSAGIHSETSCARESAPKTEQIAPAMIEANDIVTKGTKISATGSGDRTLKAKIAHS